MTNRYWCAAALAVCFSGAALADASGSFLYASIDPPVIYNDGVSTFTMQVVTIPNSGVASVYYIGPNGNVNLYDDGTHGDVTAGDGIYTNNALTNEVLQLTYNGTALLVELAAYVVMNDVRPET